MSGLVDTIFEKEGCGIPSKSYRGPIFWCKADGKGIQELWEQHLKNRVK